MSKRRDRESDRVRRGYVANRMATADSGPSAGETVLDEIVAEGCDVHLEMMNENEYMLIVYGRVETVHYFIGSKRAPVRARELERYKTNQPSKRVAK